MIQRWPVSRSCFSICVTTADFLVLCLSYLFVYYAKYQHGLFCLFVCLPVQCLFFLVFVCLSVACLFVCHSLCLLPCLMLVLYIRMFICLSAWHSVFCLFFNLLMSVIFVFLTMQTAQSIDLSAFCLPFFFFCSICLPAVRLPACLGPRKYQIWRCTTATHPSASRCVLLSKLVLPNEQGNVSTGPYGSGDCWKKLKLAYWGCL